MFVKGVLPKDSGRIRGVTIGESGRNTPYEVLNLFNQRARKLGIWPEILGKPFPILLLF